ncbi:hypothetical protein [Thiobacillus sp.]|uniref:hypothetical protein n=1 Tax=Thiobacillus sp. TaxID=924 RepID=UPI0025DB39F1|nr:hypothetical protein [Thiobacillus sp.]MBT9539526.1 hypothetical protein [Thiobacillus sp.]
MKWITWILLLANLGVAGFFVGRDYWPRTEAEQNAPLNVDRLSLRSQSASATVEKSPPTRVARLETKSLCVEWRGLSRDEFSLVREQLKALAGERVMSFTEVPLNTRIWVIFPPLPTAQAAAAKLNELAAAGVQDAFVVKDAAWHNAISLGLYANTEAAERRVREVEGKGVLGTQVEVLPRKGTDFYFVIRSEDADALKSLDAIKQAYPNSQQSRVACRS